MRPRPPFWEGERSRPIGRFLGHLPAAIGASILGVTLLVCLVAGGEPPGLQGQNLEMRFLAPSFGHPLGTDELGRDVVGRILQGGRVSLVVGLVGALAGTLLGIAVGATAALGGSLLDSLLMRLTDAFLALPLLPLLIVLSAVDPAARLDRFLTAHGLVTAGPVGDSSLANILLLVALFGWMHTARVVRATCLSLAGTEFVLAARVLGASAFRVVTRHILPNATAPILVAMTLGVGRVILYESALSFLGLGIQPPVASWGNMLAGAQEALWRAPWLAISPGAMILLTVLAVNFVGDGLQEACDPGGRPG
ncbi:MAG: ABC transporter permease [Candidatus Riflebacteria bacterium]|nr:ABC transporter permease [Candidatus Riflebacteria bacterium]